MLRFNLDSLFYKDNMFLVNGYLQISSHPKLRDATKPQLLENMRAQRYSLFIKAITKVGSEYIYLDFLLENLVYFKILYANFPERMQRIKDVDDYIANRAFIAAAENRLTEDLVNLLKIDVKTHFAAEHKTEMGIYKYDSLLHTAARNGSLEVIRVLLARGVNVDGYKPSYNYRDKKSATVNTTALGVAIDSDNVDAARLLLQHGAKIDIMEFRSKTNKKPITSKDLSPAMKQLLIEFYQLQINKDPDSAMAATSFNEQFLMHTNQVLQSRVTDLTMRLTKLEQLVLPMTHQAAAAGPTLFAHGKSNSDVLGEEPIEKRAKI